MHALKYDRPVLVDESNWCDSACDRCPLFDRCAVGQAAARRLRQIEEQDDQEAFVADLTRDLNRALVMLEQVCPDDGIDPATVELVPSPPLAGRAESVGAELVRAAAALTEAAARAGGTDSVSASRLVGNSTLIAVKTTRVAWGLGAGHRDPPDILEPILLLIERTTAQLRADSRVLAPFAPVALVAAFADAHGAMIDLVTPWIAQISEAARAELRARIAEGSAPSPFCRKGGVGTAS
jgi:hypothetical protein